MSFIDTSHMDRKCIEGKVFDKKDFTVETLIRGDYENCHFTHCNFSNADLSSIHFIECKFTSCNLGRAKLAKTTFRDVMFSDSKLLGLHFEDCNEFMLSMQFEHCILDYSSFDGLKLHDIKFSNCHLHESGFSDTYLMGAVFINCDLQGARFEQCNLEKADFSTSYNYSIDPESNRLRKARFSLNGIHGLLDKYDIIVE